MESVFPFAGKWMASTRNLQGVGLHRNFWKFLGSSKLPHHLGFAMREFACLCFTPQQRRACLSNVHPSRHQAP